MVNYWWVRRREGNGLDNRHFTVDHFCHMVGRGNCLSCKHFWGQDFCNVVKMPIDSRGVDTGCSQHHPARIEIFSLNRKSVYERDARRYGREDL